MSIAEKFEVIADAVYDKGRTDEWSDFWDIVQNNGTRTNYEYAFRYWNCEYIHPKYKVVPVEGTGRTRVFADNDKLKKVEKKFFDFSRATAVNQSTANYFTFYYCSELEEVEDIGLIGDYYTSTFFRCEKLHTIELLKSNENTTYNTAFNYCGSLQNIVFDGVIGQNIDFKWSPLLTAKSLNNITEHLKDFTGTGNSATITFNTKIEAILGTSGKAAIESKGWTLKFATP